MTTDRLIAMKACQWKLYNPDGFMEWIRENTEIIDGPDASMLVWRMTA